VPFKIAKEQCVNKYEYEFIEKEEERGERIKEY
jgi:hypothetical protein